MKTYTIVGGVNGTGKSSLTGVLTAETTDLGRVIDVDRLTAQEGGDALLGGRLALRQLEGCLEKGVSFTQETTLAGRRTERTAAQARALGYRVRLYYVALDTAEECLARIANRVRRGGHGIDEADVRRRFAARWDALERVLPYCDEARFFDNDNGFREVAQYRNGALIPLGDARPRWLTELLAYHAAREDV